MRFINDPKLYVMNARHIRNTMLLLFCTSLLYGQVAESESTSIVLNKGKVNVDIAVATPEISILSPEISDESVYHSGMQTIGIIGKVYNHEGIETVIINDVRSSLDGNGIFEAQVSLQPGSNKIELLAFDQNDNHIEKSFYVQYNTPMMLFTQRVKKESDYYALIIGVNNYEDFESLDRPVRDAENMYDILISQYTFEPEQTYLLLDAKKDQIENHLDDLANKVSPNDNLLIFFAGHGDWNEDSKVGYWLPADAIETRISSYFSNSELTVFLREIKAKHTLVIADACFGGSLLNINRSVVRNQDKEIQELYEYASCKAMVSGSLRKVNDQSPFTQSLFEELSNNNEDALTAVKLFSNFQRHVKINSGVEPKFGDIKIDMDRGGQFVFIKK